MLFYVGQWKQCCNELMKIEEPSPKKMTVTLKHGSLYHEMGKSILGLYKSISKTHLCFSKVFLWSLGGVLQLTKSKTKTFLLLEIK